MNHTASKHSTVVCNFQ